MHIYNRSRTCSPLNIAVYIHLRLVITTSREAQKKERGRRMAIEAQLHAMDPAAAMPEETFGDDDD